MDKFKKLFFNYLKKENIKIKNKFLQNINKYDINIFLKIFKFIYDNY